MSYYLQKICHKILNEYFGNIVATVGEVLFQKGSNPLRVIKTYAKLPLYKVAEAIAVLVKHNLVTWEEWRPGIPCYTLLHDRVLLILRFPRYVYLVREQFGEEGEMVVDVLLKEGQATASHIIVTSCVKLLEASDSDVGSSGSSYEQRHVTIRNHLLKLIENEFIQRCPSPQDSSKQVPVLTIKEEELYSLPSELLDLKALQQEIQHRHTENTKPTVTHPDINVFWRLNYDRFHIEFRDSEIRNSIVRRVDPLAGECLGAMLKLSYKVSDPWAPVMNVVTAAEIRDQLKDLKYLDQYFKILEEQSGECVQRVGDAGGGQYRLSMANAFQSLTYTLIYNIVQERFGSKAARIFRLVVRMVLEWCYKALYNLMVQRETRAIDNRRLLDKRTRVDSIVENLKQSGGTDEQIQEVEEMMTPSERALVEQVLATQDKLFDAEMGLDETIFILQMFLYYQIQKV
ncbi:DNA-directed RNA polymerase III subunit RPC3 [Panulirus ornatus]|uniref:DNA-directed RNA polymerase III subunit RPC3 n=1 Tax=Panulirus ornatus TaxID=150431 RepID=UPI003A8A28CC